jgi:hypothetical protein
MMMTYNQDRIIGHGQCKLYISDEVYNQIRAFNESQDKFHISITINSDHLDDDNVFIFYSLFDHESGLSGFCLQDLNFKAFMFEAQARLKARMDARVKELSDNESNQIDDLTRDEIVDLVCFDNI